MELYVDPEVAGHLIEIADSFNIRAQIIGEVRESEENRVTIDSTVGTFEY